MTLSDWLRRQEVHYGPVNKGVVAKGQALQNATSGADTSATLLGEGENEQQSELLPFLNSEITNPSGYGQPALNAMTTATGQAASGATANATEQAKLNAARTGNTAGQSAIIANAARSGANAQTNANNQVQIGNAEEKLKQQQQGAQGLGQVASSDLSGGLGALGLSNEAINAWSNANKSAGNLWSNVGLPLIQAGGQAAGAAFGG
jgi:hypothetical protein